MNFVHVCVHTHIILFRDYELLKDLGLSSAHDFIININEYYININPRINPYIIQVLPVYYIILTNMLINMLILINMLM